MTKKEKREPFFKVHLKNRLKDIPTTTVSAVYIAFCLATIIYCIATGNYRDIAACVSYSLVVPLAYVAEYSMRLKLPVGYLIIVYMFMTGNLLGQAYNLYTIVPVWDVILHAMWSVVFSIMGIAIVKSLIGAPKSNGGALAYLLFGIGFCMLTSVMWEIYEFTGDSLFANLDMQEDTIVKSIHSFMLHPDYDHLHTFQIDGIAYTQLFDANGNLLYTIEGGYLDIGLHDTMSDLIACFVASAAFSVIMAVDWFTTKTLYWIFIPESKKEYFSRGKREEESFVEVEINPDEQPKPYLEEQTADGLDGGESEGEKEEEIAEVTE